MKRRRRRLIWHRYRDLRLHDNPLYHDNKNKNKNNNSDSSDVGVESFECIPLLVLDDDDFIPRPSTCRPHHWTAVTIGPHACRILLESVQDLRQSLRQRNSDLVVKKGNAISILRQMLRDTRATELVWNQEPGVYEQDRSQLIWQLVEQEFPHLSVEVFADTTLYHPDDLPRGVDEWERLAHPNRASKTKSKNNKKCEKNTNDDSSKPTNKAFVGDHTNSHSLSNKHQQQVDITPSRFVGMPSIMGEFRRAAQNKTTIRSCLQTPSTHCHLWNSKDQSVDSTPVSSGEIPSLRDLLDPLLSLNKETDDCKLILGLPHSLIYRVCQHALEQYEMCLTNNQSKIESSFADTRSVTRHPRTPGGETAGLYHLTDFLQHHDATNAQRNFACVENYQSARVSHHLAFGTLSPRIIVQLTQNRQTEVEQQQERGEIKRNTNFDWLISHMTMRDFFLYTCLASDCIFYRRDGIPVNIKVASSLQWRRWNFEVEEPKIINDLTRDNKTTESVLTLWKRWAMGNTGLPLVDAAIHELIHTGYCSNRVRQNAASVLTKDLHIDWRAGAEWFQFLLCDHCVGANWGNWLYFSGVGNDPKHRHFRTVSQALKYDPKGLYVRKWIPRLDAFVDSARERHPTIAEVELALRPWDFSASQSLEDYNDDFCPIVPPETQYTWKDLERLKSTGSLQIHGSI